MRWSFLFSLVLVATVARGDYRAFTATPVDLALEARVRAAAEQSLAQFPKLKARDLAISVIDISNPDRPVRADYQGTTPFYPASVIKMFFMTDVFLTGKQSIGDVDRALKEMIVVSDNDATAYLVDVLAETAPGAPLTGEPLSRFIERRRAINRRFQKLGYLQMSAMMKPWSFGPFGRDLQALGTDRVNRNRMTANEASSLLLWIVTKGAPSADAQLALLERPLAPRRADENQVDEFIGSALPEGSRLWSKAGWTSEVRMDAAYVELPDGRKLVVSIFTRGQAGDVTLIPAITKNVLNAK